MKSIFSEGDLVYAIAGWNKSKRTPGINIVVRD